MHDLKVNDPIKDRHEAGNTSQPSETNLEDRHFDHLDMNSLEEQIHTF